MEHAYGTSCLPRIIFSCSICGEYFQEPKMLSCYHSFCSKCLTTRLPSESLTLTCPDCSANSILPRDGVESLRNSLFMPSMMDNFSVEKPVPYAGNEEMNSVENGRKLPTDETSPNAPINLIADDSLSEHIPKVSSTVALRLCECGNGKDVEVLCKTCERLLCGQCASAHHGKHRESLTSLGVAANDCKERLLQKTEQIRLQMKTLDRMLADVDLVAQDLAVNRDHAELAATAAFQELEVEIDRRKEQAFAAIENGYVMKQKVLDRQRQELLSSHKDMSSAIQFTESTLEDHRLPGNALALSHNDEIVRNEQPCRQSSSSETSVDFLDNAVKTYLLHRHMTQRLSDLHNIGRIRRNAHGAALNGLDESNICNKSSGSHNVLPLPIRVHNAPSENSSFAWERSSDLSRLVEEIRSTSFGNIRTNHAVAGQSNLSGNCLRSEAACVIGREERIILTMKDCYGNLDKHISIPVDAELTLVENYSSTLESKSSSQALSDCLIALNDPPIAPAIKCKVIPSRSGSYEIRFTPNKSGVYVLNVRINGTQVRNSPHRLKVSEPSPAIREDKLQSKTTPTTLRSKGVRQRAMKRPQSIGPIKTNVGDDLLFRLGSRGRSNGEFSNPQDVATDASGRFFVTDSNNQCIQVFGVKHGFQMETKNVQRFGDKGRGLRQIQRPTGIAILPSGDFVVSDYENKVVHYYHSNGKYKARIGAGKLMGPRGVCINNDQHLVVADNKLCEIFIFQVNGKLVTKFGSRGTGAGELAGPHYVAVNRNNEIFVTDFYNHCVKVFSSSGAYIRSFGSKGEGCGQFNAPTGIAIDVVGHVIVADWGNSRIQIFDEAGSFLSYINADSEPLYGPQGVTSTHQGYVAVADSGNQCIKVYRILQ